MIPDNQFTFSSIPLRSILLLLLLCSSLGCQSVKPWQKGNLAKWHMVFEPDPLESRYKQHVYFSKEGMSGGYGVGGGGCGCN